MRALRYQRPRKLILIDKEIPGLRSDEVLVKIAFAGVCGTDLHILNEEAPASDSVILGHEFSGVVAEADAEVHAFQVGDHVAVDPNNYCGCCKYCRSGHIHFCENIRPIGINKDGSWAEYCVAPGNQVYKLPESLPLEWGALAEPLSCIVHGWDRLQPLNRSQSVLIIGAGLIGLLWGLLLKNCGHDKTVISEPVEARRIIAESLGFSSFHSDQIFQNGSSGFDVIIDCSGNPKAIEQALNYLNPLGKFLFFGVCPADSHISIKPYSVFQNEWTFLGSVINPFTFARTIDLMPAWQIPLEKLGVAFYELENFKHALRDVKNGIISKALFKLAP